MSRRPVTTPTPSTGAPSAQSTQARREKAARFAPGTTLASRYRLMRLGRAETALARWREVETAAKARGLELLARQAAAPAAAAEKAGPGRAAKRSG